MNKVDITVEQKRKWGETMSLLTWTAPGFRHLFYKLLCNHNGEYLAIFTPDVPRAATDGSNILLNPDWFFKQAPRKRVGTLIHEIMHCALDDINTIHRLRTAGSVPTPTGGSLDYVEDDMQKSLDFRINDTIISSHIAELPDNVCLDKSMGTAQDSFIDIYPRVHKQKPSNKNQQALDQILAPGTSTGQDPQTAAAGRNAQQWAIEVAVAKKLEEMKSQGNMPGGLNRFFQQILEPEIDWTQHLKTLVSRHAGSGNYNWRKPDRRFIVRDLYMPSRTGFGAGWIVCWGDTSGSRGDDEVASNISELAGIIEDIRPRRLTILWCDAAIDYIDEITDYADLENIKARGVGGSGGTSVDPVLKWIEDQHDVPDMFIGFTDGYVSYPPVAPSYPVIWCSSTDYQYPFGEVVRVLQKGRKDA